MHVLLETQFVVLLIADVDISTRVLFLQDLQGRLDAVEFNEEKRPRSHISGGFVAHGSRVMLSKQNQVRHQYF